MGVNSDGSDRTEVRAWGDVKPAYLREGAGLDARPKRGRPRKIPDPQSTPTETVASIDFTKPPPNWKAGNSKIQTPAADPISTTGPPPYKGFLRNEAWSASQQDLHYINASIAGSPVRCEARG